MKKYLVAIVIGILIPSIASAECDWQFIKNMSNGDYEYSPECHLKVGQLVQDNQVKLTQINDLNAALQLKDLAIQTSDARVALWQKTADDSMDRLTKVDSNQRTNEIIYFALGALTVLGAGWMASHLLHP